MQLIKQIICYNQQTYSRLVRIISVESMDPRLYTYQRRTPRHQNPTFISQFVNDSLHLFRGGPLDPRPTQRDKVTESTFKQVSNSHSLYYPPQISKIRSSFENNRSKVPLSNISSYARQIMFPTQKAVNNQQNKIKTINPQQFLKNQLFLDNKQKNYIKQICKMNNKFLSKSEYQSPDVGSRLAAGRASIVYNDNDKKHYKYKHSHDRYVQNKEQNVSQNFKPSRLNYADELRGIV